MNNSAEFKQYVRIVSWLTAIAFSLFTVVYTYCMQSQLLAQVQDILSEGKTSYNPLWGTIIITLLLLLLKSTFRKIIAYPLRFHALYYFPSCLVLGILTALTPIGDESISLSVNWVILTIIILLFVLVSWIALHYPDRKNIQHSLVSLLWPNLFLLTLLIAMAAGIGNTEEILQRSLHL